MKSVVKSDDDDDDNDDDDDFHFTPRSRKLTPRLPPLQKPLGTRFNEEAPVQKSKKKKKRKLKLKAVKENTDELIEDSDDHFTHSKKSLQSISKIEVDSILSNGYSTFENIESGGKQRRSYKIENDDSEYIEEKIPRSKKKKSKKKNMSSGMMSNGYGYDLSTPRTLGNLEDDSDADYETSPRRNNEFDSGRVSELIVFYMYI